MRRSLIVLCTLVLVGCSSSEDHPAPVASTRQHVASLSISTDAGAAECSGAPIVDTNLVLTARHCVQDARRVTVVVDGNTQQGISVHLSDSADIAVVELASQNTAGYSLAVTKPSGSLVAVGYQNGVLTECPVTSWQTPEEASFPCGMLPGASGGPVIEGGSVVGVISQLTAEWENTAAPAWGIHPTNWPRVTLS